MAFSNQPDYNNNPANVDVAKHDYIPYCASPAAQLYWFGLNTAAKAEHVAQLVAKFLRFSGKAGLFRNINSLFHAK